MPKNPEQKNEPILVPVDEWSRRFGWPKLGTLHNLVRHPEHFGLEAIVVEKGKAKFLDQEKFAKWVMRARPDLKGKRPRPLKEELTPYA